MKKLLLLFCLLSNTEYPQISAIDSFEGQLDLTPRRRGIERNGQEKSGHFLPLNGRKSNHAAVEQIRGQ